MPTLFELTNNGQSVWIDTLSRSMMDTNQLQAFIDMGVQGVTANPTILDKAISGSTDYDHDIRRLALEGRSPREIYDEIVLADIRRAADFFRPVFDRTDGSDGFVSLEVNPELADDAAATIAEVRRLAAAIDRPNVMIKVPATPNGMQAIEQLTSEGININITLIFSLAQYQAVAEAYIAGLERLQRARGDLRKVNSVASFFVSRIDTAVDTRLQEIRELELQGKIAIANAKLAYVRFIGIFTSQRWRALQEKGARIQRPLWASTGVKNPKYLDTMYVDQLIGPNTVNTMPLDTLSAFLDHGSIAPRVELGLDVAQFQLARLHGMDIDLDEITRQLLADGVRIFVNAYRHTLTTIAGKAQAFENQERGRAA